MNRTSSSHLEHSKKIAQLVHSRLIPGTYRECLFCEQPSPSQPRKVRGHSIQRALISKFLAESGHVIMLRNDMSANMKAMHGQIARPSAKAELVGVNQATTGYFTCAEHERIFKPIEQGTLDLSQSAQLFLFALRAIAFQTWRVRAAHNAWHSAVKEVDSVPYTTLIPLEFFANALQRVDSTWQSIVGRYAEKRYERIKHKVVRLKTSPTLAVCEWSAFGEESYLDCGLTVLPITTRHTTAIIHYFEKDTDTLYNSLGHLFAATKQGQKQILSRVVIEDFENVTLSPRVWDQFSPEKQQRIKDHYMDTIRDPNLHRLVNIKGEEHLNFFLD